MTNNDEPIKMKLKGKYRAKKSEGSSGRSKGSTNSKKVLVGEAARMQNEQAIKLHYENCAANGWWEQLPSGARDRYKAEHEKAMKEKLDKQGQV